MRLRNWACIQFKIGYLDDTGPGFGNLNEWLRDWDVDPEHQRQILKGEKEQCNSKEKEDDQKKTKK